MSTDKHTKDATMDQRCSHCDGIHFGSLPGKCPYICDSCGKDIRPDVTDGCTCEATGGSMKAEPTSQKHTPGEWTYQLDADGDFAIFGGELGTKLLAVTTSDTPEDEANAYLFAAASRMFSILKAMTEDEGFSDLCQGIGEEPEWLKDSRAIVAAKQKTEVKP